jgi:hypothetical protein
MLGDDGYNPSYLEGARFMAKNPSQPIAGHTCHPVLVGRIVVQTGLGKKRDPISKITQAKRVGVVAQAGSPEVKA